MKSLTVSHASRFIVYDADALPRAGPELFDPAYWREQGLLCGAAAGRGSTLFIDAPFGQAALRRYLRGGWAARLSRDRYVFTGAARSRPFREYHLLRRLQAEGLPVPAPLGALVDRAWPFYRGALLTRRIDNVRPLAELLGDGEADWARVGRTLRRFHEAGLDHADLNARNILVNPDTAAVWLLDFDRSRYRPGRPVDGRRNLARLRRSLDRLWPPGASGRVEAWERLVDAYREAAPP